MSASRSIKVFIASPGDLTVERRAFKEVIDELNKGFGRGAGVTFEPLGWEDALSTVGRRSQAVINQDIDACDVFVLVMWQRWGQAAPDAKPFSSYTEEEFNRALALLEKNKKPTIFVFFKHIDPSRMADPGRQLKKVLAFRKKLEATRKVLHRPFVDEATFKDEIDKHLVAYARGKCDAADAACDAPLMPESIMAERKKDQAELRRAVKELEKLRAQAKLAQDEAEHARTQAKDAAARADAAERVAETRANTRAIALAEEAAKAARDGRIEEARQGFAKALDGTTQLGVLSLGYDFFRRIGELEEAERLLRRWLAISGPDTESAETAAAYGNLGILLETRGDLDAGEAMFRRSLAISEKLGRSEVANQYGNLGIVLRMRGDLDGAEAMHRKALAIDEALDRAEGMASHYGNLAHVMQARGDLAEAEAMCRKSLAIFEKLGLLDSVARQYCNLGNVLQMRRDFAGADAVYRKALAIDEKLGRLEGMAATYDSLAVLMKTQGNLDGVRDFCVKSRDLYSRLGMKQLAKRMQMRIDGLLPIC